MKKRILSLVMALVMVIGFAMPVQAAEGDAAATTTNGSYTNGVWAAGGTGSVTHTVDGTAVTLSKTAAPVEGEENVFDITLKVETSTTTTSETNSGAVVLVIDVSGSMNYCAECGGDGEHKSNCDKNTGSERNPSSVKQTESRIAATKAAARTFLASYAGTDPAANRQLSIVTFAKNYSTKLDWVNVAGGAGKNSYDTAISSINGLSANGGTNLEGGLYTALGQLSDVSNFGSKNVILLTDGVPTYRMNGGNGSSGSEENNSAAAKRATAIKNTGAKLYTVCFGVANEKTYSNGPTVGNFLRDSVASSGCAYNADNTAELNSAFAAITEKITSGLSGEGWTATDPMADMISVTGGTSANFSGSDGTYTWKLSNAETVTSGNQTKYVYTYTYRVTLDVQDENFVEGQFFPTNEQTYLNIDGAQYAFPVPGVKGVLPRTSVTATKVWKDSDNKDGIRPESVTLQLLKNGVAEGEAVTLNAENDWTYTWTDLIEMSGGIKHKYTVEEAEVDGYTASYSEDGLTVTNTHIPEQITINGEKTWNDAENQDGIRPESITINLLADGVTVDSKKVTAEDGWKWSFTVDKYADNKVKQEVVYTITEETVDGYTATVSGYNVTNTHAPSKTSVTVTKVWDDANNQDGIRPNEITVNLLADGVATGETLDLTAANQWTGVFADLDEYKAGTPIEYSVAEAEVPAGYNSAVVEKSDNVFEITNSHTPEQITINGAKTWDDAENQDGKRPDSITIKLLADNVVVETKTVTESDNWSWSFTGLPKYKEGKLISYTVEEAAVDGYTAKVEGYNVTNTYDPEKVSVSVKKVWDDANNQDGIRPADITVKLLANGKKEAELVLSEGNGWSGTFQDLDKYARGKEIVYTIEEVAVENYTSQITGSQTEGFTVTNSYTPAVTDIEVTKTWVDNDNQDGMRPEAITVNLLANGETVETQQITADTEWKWTFEDLPVNKAGQQIVYTVAEEAVENYTTQIDGFAITNTHAPGKVSVQVTKAWDDSDNQDGIRPETVTVTLFADGVATDNTLELTAEGNWTGSFQDLDEYNAGEKIVYTVQEKEVDGYESVVTGSQAQGFVITNSYNPELISVSGAKTWNDNNNQDGKRPDSITINLLKDGKVLETKTVTEADGWAWTFENLPKYENQGTEIAYAITEKAVEGYTTTYDGYNVINSYTPEEISVTVTKAWADSNDAEGIRPESVTIKLLANGKNTGLTLELDAENKWTGSFTGLAKYEDGKAIDYTVDEVKVKGYNSVVKGTMEDGFVVTNSHTYIPQTGDDRTPMLWVSVMAMSGLMIALAVIGTKKRRAAK